MKTSLMPPADAGLSALLEDLDQRGLLQETLVVAMGEFGRTPRINKNAGRDHWPHVFSVLLAGAGLHGGAIYGSSDKRAAFPKSNPVSPGDLAATIFHALGIDHSTRIYNQAGQPHHLALGEPITDIFA